MKKRSFVLSISFLLCFSSITYLGATQHRDQKNYYAISSLIYHLEDSEAREEIYDEENIISFDEADIAELWEDSFDVEFFTDEIQRAYTHYYEGSVDSGKKEALAILNGVREGLDEIGATTLQSEAIPYLLSKDSWLQKPLKKIFSKPDVLKDASTIEAAGFITICHRTSGMRVLKHPKLPGYLIKTYLSSERKKQGNNLRWMIDRCKGAENVRNLIKSENLKHFTVPDKWIYHIPARLGEDAYEQSAVLVVTDMDLVSREECKIAWEKATKSQIKELYCILSHGFASCYLVHNIPYTKAGTFACIDTAYPYRNYRRYAVRSYFSEEMKEYWDLLVETNEKRK